MLAEQVFSLLQTFGVDLDIKILNNGSMDGTYKKLLRSFDTCGQVSILNSTKNLGYGGGMKALIESSTTRSVCMIPADGQYSTADITTVIAMFLNQQTHNEGTFVIGHRSTRSDAPSQILSSKVYSWLVSKLWHIPKHDVNALPKIFPVSILSKYERFADNFVFDAQLIWIAHQENLVFMPVPVEFHRRSAGVSSWSGKRIKTYIKVTSQLLSGPPTRKRMASS